MDCSGCEGVGSGLENMLCAIDLCDAEIVSQNLYSSPTSITNCTLEQTYEAVEHFGSIYNDLTPKLNGSYALMASGYAEGAAHSKDCNEGENGVSDPWAVGDDDSYLMYDAVEWSLTMIAPPEAKAFRFKYVFFSAEYEEFISSPFNDKFYVFLEADSTNDGAKTLINFTECREPDTYWDFVCEAGDSGCEEGEKYCYIAINSALSECCWYPYGSPNASDSSAPSCPSGFASTSIMGTGFECASSVDLDHDDAGSSTGWLQTTWPITGGEELTVTFHVHDTSATASWTRRSSSTRSSFSWSRGRGRWS